MRELLCALLSFASGVAFAVTGTCISAEPLRVVVDRPDYYCEYIESRAQYVTPPPWIDTGVRATPLTRLSMEIEFPSSPINASQLSLFGLHYISGSLPKFAFIAYIGDGSTKYIDYKYVDGGWNSSGVSSVTNALSRMTVTMDGVAKTFTITTNNVDGTTEALCSKNLAKSYSWANDFQSEHTIPLFNKWNSSGAATNLFNKSLAARLYGCTISTNNVLVRSFRPAVKGGAPGLWDEVDGVFYPSASDVPFLAGPKIKRVGLKIIFR